MDITPARQHRTHSARTVIPFEPVLRLGGAGPFPATSSQGTSCSPIVAFLLAARLWVSLGFLVGNDLGTPRGIGQVAGGRFGSGGLVGHAGKVAPPERRRNEKR